MNQTNCPNCGAPYDSCLTKCPYCGTNYFDLSFINMDTVSPFYIKLNKSIIYKNHVFPCNWTIRVVPSTDSVQLTTQTEYGEVKNCHNAVLFHTLSRADVFLTLNFVGVPDKKGNVFTMSVQGDNKQ